MVTVLEDDAPALSTVQKWVGIFRRERESLEDNARFRRPVTDTTDENIYCVPYMLMDDRRLIINQIANAISISCKRVENTVHNELGVTRMSARWVPRILTIGQKCTRLITSRENLTLFEEDPAGFLERFLEPKTKRQSM
ncbi:uncharacterized protein LOC128249249 [Octopus bimaculoides]|uniref:uncharacterized protein LOC128249249 n=1 Tax=Octopus bimaculoides TaxID=37653 RepID=UPI0022E00C14|nr:uncharacterized protein LOC128249249 [Octopus bimaculoides]